MHLALLIGRFPPGVVGGAEIQAEGWARALSNRYRVVVVTRRDPPWQPAEEARDGFVVKRLPVSRLPVWRAFRDVAAVERTIAALSPRPDLTLCFQTFVSGLAGVRVQTRLGIPAVVWIRGEEELDLRFAARSRWISPRVWSAARGVIVQSERVGEAVLERLRRVAPRAAREVAQKLEVVPNGLDLPPAPSPGGGTGVLAVGRLIPEKGMDTAIQAAAAAKQQLTIAGDGPDRARLEALARSLPARVRFMGMVPRDRLDMLYREAACVVLAARGGEGLPNVLLEAMARARPVVATPVMGVRDLVRDGANGLLVEPGDPVALATALMRLAGENGLAARLGGAARATAEGFEWERVRPRLEALLERWASR
jgi:glycosyltransferase involved in cell wall biosynthesis